VEGRPLVGLASWLMMTKAAVESKVYLLLPSRDLEFLQTQGLVQVQAHCKPMMTIYQNS